MLIKINLRIVDNSFYRAKFDTTAMRTRHTVLDSLHRRKPFRFCHIVMFSHDRLAIEFCSRRERHPVLVVIGEGVFIGAVHIRRRRVEGRIGSVSLVSQRGLDTHRTNDGVTFAFQQVHLAGRIVVHYAADRLMGIAQTNKQSIRRDEGEEGIRIMYTVGRM
jgi:hypothetical protein